LHHRFGKQLRNKSREAATHPLMIASLDISILRRDHRGAVGARSVLNLHVIEILADVVLIASLSLLRAHWRLRGPVRAESGLESLLPKP
jgi:hypothetical protein